MILYILQVTVIITVCFLFYKILLQKETFYRLNRWTLMACLAVSFALPLLPAPRGWSWRNNYENVLAALLTAPTPNANAPAPNSDAPAPSSNASAPSSGWSTTSGQKTPPLQLPAHTTAESHTSAFHTTSASSHPTRWTNQPTQFAQPADPAHSATADPAYTATADPAHTATAGPAHRAVTNPAHAADKDPIRHSASRNASAGTSLLQWVLYLYCFGVIVFGANFLLQVLVLLYQSYRSPVVKDGRFRIVETSGHRAPCSFGNNIFINPSIYDWETYNQILIHEKIHVSGRHTFDILLAEIVVVLQWFNPFAWLYRKEVENNLEFLTDQSVLLHREVERSAYQLSLLRVSAPHLPFSITTNYNQSLLKRRIVMMNSQHSSLRTIWKYFFLIPVLTVLVCALNKPAVFGQSATAGDPRASAQPAKATLQHPATQHGDATARAADTTGHKTDPAGKHKEADEWSTDPSDAMTITTTATHVNNSFAQTETISSANVQLSSEPVIATTVSVNSNPYVSVNTSPSISVHGLASTSPMTTNLSVNPSIAIQNVATSISIRDEEGDETEGAWFVTTTESGKLEFELKGETENHHWSNSLNVEKSEINPFPGQGTVEFKIVREAGTIVFKGQFDGQQGFGRYKFTADEGFLNWLKQQGVEDLEEKSPFSFFLANVKKDYVSMLLHNGFPHISRRSLVSMAYMHVDEEFIKSWKQAGFNDLQERELISAKAMHIDPAYARELKEAGYDQLSMRELTSLKSMKIDAQYIKSFRSMYGKELPPVRDIISFKSMHIDSDYVASLKRLGYDNLPYREIISLHSMNVTPDFIKSYQAVGYKDIPTHTLISLKSLNITPEYIKGFKDIGYEKIELRDLHSLRSMNITPEYIKGFKEIGYDNVDLRDLSSLKALGVTPAYAKDFQKIGYDHVPLRELRTLKSMGIDAAYISRMKEKGFDSKDLNKYIRLKNAFD